MKDRSPLAKQHKRTSPLELRRSQLFGACLHTTGVGILDRKPDSLTWVTRYYCSQSECGHYVIAPDGEIHQMAGEDQRAWHAGLADPPNALELYKNGRWVDLVSGTALAMWRKRWPGCESPIDIFGGGSPNDLFVGIEFIPRADRTFTPAQYFSGAQLLTEMGERRGIEFSGRRLLGHEDLHPLRRWEAGGGWDPGALRREPRFSWAQLQSRMKQGSSANS